MSSGPSMTTTSYAILGLLAVRPWTTHELVQQVDRSLRRIWPRAQSKLYEEPKKLVAHGYAASDRRLGRSPPPDPLHDHREGPAGARRVAAAAGRGPRRSSSSSCVKIHFADSGTKADVLANLDAARAWVLEQNEENLAAGPCLPRRAGPVPAASRAQPARPGGS